MPRSKRNLIQWIVILTILFLIVLLTLLFYNGYIWLNIPSIVKYPVRGIDISHHQESIDWSKVTEKEIDFVFIKATEGDDFVDHRFTANWANSRKYGISRGAYHFFSFKSSGLAQAHNVIRNVPREKGCIPLVIDLEFGPHSKKLPPHKQIVRELQSFVAAIERHYNYKPIFYVTYETYNHFVAGNFRNHPIWICDIIKYPRLKDQREWQFWQYCSRGHVRGIKGFVDLNAFKGDTIEFEALLTK